jgi:tetratricopeptide (TPR) repeat protein
VLDAQNRLTEGIHYIKKAIELNALNPEYWYVFAEVQNKLGFQDEAINAFLKVIELGYDDFDIYLDYSNVLIENGYELEAISVLEQGLKLFPDAAELHYRMSAQLMMLG